MAKKKSNGKRFWREVANGTSGLQAMNDVWRHTADGETTHFLSNVACTYKYKGAPFCVACQSYHFIAWNYESLPIFTNPHQSEDPYFD